MQWGIAYTPYNNSQTYVTLPVPFPNKGLSVNVNPNGDWSGASKSWRSAWFTGNQQICIAKGDYKVYDMMYFAIGY